MHAWMRATATALPARGQVMAAAAAAGTSTGCTAQTHTRRLTRLKTVRQNKLQQIWHALLSPTNCRTITASRQMSTGWRVQNKDTTPPHACRALHHPRLHPVAGMFGHLHGCCMHGFDVPLLQPPVHGWLLQQAQAGPRHRPCHTHPPPLPPMWIHPLYY